MILPILILILFLMFPSQLALTLTKWTKKSKPKQKTWRDGDGILHTKTVYIREKCTPSEILMCYLPYTSGIMIWKALYRKYGWPVVVSILSAVGIIFRVAVVFLTTDAWLFLVSFCVFWVCVLLFHLVYAIPCAVTAYMYSMSWLTICLSFICPYGMAWYLNNNVPRVMKKIAEEEEEDNRFKG